MTRRAKYDGPYKSIVVDLSQGDTNRASEQVVVERGKLLPDDVPAKIRDELLASEYWSEVKQTETDKKEGEK